VRVIRNVGFGLLGTWKSLRLLSTLGRSFYLLVFIWERGGGGVGIAFIILFADRYARIRPAKGEHYNVAEAESRCCILRSTSVDSPTLAFGLLRAGVGSA